MARLLSDLLGAPEPGFSLMVKRLEQASGRPSADVRLATEIADANKRKIRTLKLDVADTTGPELYHSLQQLLRQHDEALLEALGGRPGSVEELLQRIRDVIGKLHVPKNCRTIKPTAAKRLLKSMPPKNVMKQLGYRSIDSLLKRQKVTEIFSAFSIIESAAWRKKFIAKYQTLSASDFEDRDIEIVVLSPEKWGHATTDFVTKERRNLVCTKEMGVIAVLPLPDDRLKGLAITMVPLVIDYMHQIRTFSVYCKLHHMQANVGKLVAEALNGQSKVAAVLAGNPLPWTVVHRHFGSSQSKHLHIYGPHVQPADLEWRPIGETVAKIHPDLSFWHGPEYLGAAYHDGVVSYNLLDAAINYCNNVPYHKRYVFHMRNALIGELYVRYLRQPHMEQDIVRQLETNLTT